MEDRHRSMIKRLIVVVTILAVLLGVLITYAQSEPIFGNRLLSLSELENMPINSKVWLEYNHDRIGLYQDEAMIITEKTGVGRIMHNETGYWALRDTWYFGYKYRVWVKPPVWWHSFIIPWNNSPWD